jgi:cytoskeletal protein CcmA (bactofilin family)
MADAPRPGSETLIGSDVSIKGEMSFDGSMRIEGKVEGKIQSKGRIAFGQGASVVAEVSVGQAKIEGTFKGNITAAERIELASTAHVMGDVRSTKLVIAEGATFVGNCFVSPDALKVVEKSEFVTPVAATPIKK